jgi:hypothetical protein
MILPFSTKMNGKPTYFVEKIILGLVRNNLITIDFASELLDIPISEIRKLVFKSKLHTFREDKKDRWHAGRMIDFFINCRQPTMFRFAPVLPVVSVQKVEIFYKGLFAAVAIDKELFYTDADFKLGKSTAGMLQLAQNDGFDTIEDFFAYFNEDFKGKIIHWTDLRY